MPRKGNVPKREVLADPIYGSKVVTKLINNLMIDGKKGKAQTIVYDAFAIIAEKTGEDALEVFNKAMDNIMPVLEVKARRVGGANYQVPVEVRPERRQTLGLRWLVNYTRARGEKGMVEKLAKEIMDAANNTGASVKKNARRARHPVDAQQRRHIAQSLGYNYVQYAGTSMATPHVSGVVSLMLSANPALTPAQVTSKIQTTARVFPATDRCAIATPQASKCNCTTALCGAGILDAGAAVASAGGGGERDACELGEPGQRRRHGHLHRNRHGQQPHRRRRLQGRRRSSPAARRSLTGSGNTKTAQCATARWPWVCTHRRNLWRRCR